jgi:uncharacterized membrane protein YphA (DoxX/SURF4 family)
LYAAGVNTTCCATDGPTTSTTSSYCASGACLSGEGAAAAEQRSAEIAHQITMADGKGKRIGEWVLAGILAAMFLFAGGFKLSGAQTAIDNFAKWGYPDWFRIVTGVIEVTAAILVLVPRTSFYGTLLILPTMVGAVITHVTHGETPNVGLPIVLFALAAVLAYLRRPEWLGRSSWRRVAGGGDAN